MHAERRNNSCRLRSRQKRICAVVSLKESQIARQVSYEAFPISNSATKKRVQLVMFNILKLKLFMASVHVASRSSSQCQRAMSYAARSLFISPAPESRNSLLYIYDSIHCLDHLIFTCSPNASSFISHRGHKRFLCTKCICHYVTENTSILAVKNLDTKELKMQADTDEP
jgi:hypothetical protein